MFFMEPSNLNQVLSLALFLAKSSSNLKSIYFIFGEDHFTINNAIKLIEEKAAPFLTSDFDKETIFAEKKADISGLVDLAFTFPFGSDKKLLVINVLQSFLNHHSKLLAE